MNEQQPSPGRIVRYTTNDGKVVPAVITHVHPDGNVDLHVLHTTTFDVPQVDGSAAAVTGHSWHWPSRT